MQQLSEHPSIPPEARALLRDFTAGLTSTLGPQLAGAYLHGSLALGAFDPASSDLDFLAVTAGVLNPAEVSSLAELHAALARQHPHWGNELEGSYVPLADLASLRPASDICPGIERGGPLKRCPQDLAYRVVHLYILGRCGIVLAGPRPPDLLPAVSEADLCDAVLRILRGWWAPMLDDTRRLQDLHYRSYAIQTMCRILYTLSEGGVAPKPHAARWAIERYGAPWAGLIESATAWPRRQRPAELDETCAFIRFVLNAAAALPPQ